jgi:putative ABC transport system permease protein
VFWHRLLDRLRALPGVTSVTMIDGMLPARPINANDLNLPGRVQKPGEPWNVDYWQIVGDDFVETLGARVVKGRALSRSDTADSPPVTMVNEAFVAKFFPGIDPIGQQVEIDQVSPPRKPIYQTVVGVVADIKQAGIDRPAGTEVFLPTWQYTRLSDPPESQHASYFVVRTAQAPAGYAAVVTRVIAELDPTLPVTKLRTMDDVMWEAIARPRFLSFLLTCFAGIALLLAAVGIYGVMAHTVAQRTHEIGVRVALGAQPAQVRAMILRQAGGLVVAGVAVGLGTAIGLQLILDASLVALFYGERLSQPVLLAGVAVAVTVTALVATWIPAWRATKVEPTVALRSE